MAHKWKRKNKDDEVCEHCGVGRCRAIGYDPDIYQYYTPKGEYILASKREEEVECKPPTKQSHKWKVLDEDRKQCEYCDVVYNDEDSPPTYTVLNMKSHMDLPCVPRHTFVTPKPGASETCAHCFVTRNTHYGRGRLLYEFFKEGTKLGDNEPPCVPREKKLKHNFIQKTRGGVTTALWYECTICALTTRYKDTQTECSEPTDKEVCPACYGSKLVDNRECSSCEGTGSIRVPHKPTLVTALPTEKGERQKEIVECLETALEAAKAGDMTFVMILYRNQAGELIRSNSSSGSFVEVVGMLEYLKNRYIANNTENIEE